MPFARITRFLGVWGETGEKDESSLKLRWQGDKFDSRHSADFMGQLDRHLPFRWPEDRRIFFIQPSCYHPHNRCWSARRVMRRPRCLRDGGPAELRANRLNAHAVNYARSNPRSPRFVHGGSRPCFLPANHPFQRRAEPLQIPVRILRTRFDASPSSPSREGAVLCTARTPHDLQRQRLLKLTRNELPPVLSSRPMIHIFRAYRNSDIRPCATSGLILHGQRNEY